MNNFDELLKTLGDQFKDFCYNPNHELEGVIIGTSSGFQFCYEDPDLLFEDDNAPKQIEVFMESLMESILHYKALLKRFF